MKSVGFFAFSNTFHFSKMIFLSLYLHFCTCLTNSFLLICSAREHGLHVNEVVQRLGLPLDKILYLLFLFPLFLNLSVLYACGCSVLALVLLCVFKWFTQSLVYSLLILLYWFSREAIHYHVDVGHIYSTIDDDHYKSAMNGWYSSNSSLHWSKSSNETMFISLTSSANLP